MGHTTFQLMTIQLKKVFMLERFLISPTHFQVGILDAETVVIIAWVFYGTPFDKHM